MLRISVIGSIALLALVACSAPADDSNSSESNIISLLPGSGIQSPNAKTNATYLSVRSIANLQAVGALSGSLLDLANRTDGIISTHPDGRLSVQELLQIEKPGYIDTLFPEEKAALPQLWALMETTNAAPTTVTIPDASTISVTDVSSPSTTPIEPTSLAISTLPSTLQRAAARLELTLDSDGDPQSVTKADLASAIANPGPYLPSEIDEFKSIQKLFLDRAGTTLSAKVLVNEPTATTSTLASWGAAQLSLNSSLDFSESRVADVTQLTTSLKGHVSQRAVVTLTSPVKVLILDTGTEKESIVASGTLESDGGTKTVEVWGADGHRQGSYRVQLPNLKAVDTNVDLSQYADYTFVLADGRTLNKRAVSGSSQYIGGPGGYQYTVVFGYTTDGTESSTVDPNTVAQTVTPKTAVAPGRYTIPTNTAEGNVIVDIFGEGIIRVTRTNGTVQRAVFRNSAWTLPSGDLGFSYDAVNNVLRVSSGSATLFSGPLTGALRTG